MRLESGQVSDGYRVTYSDSHKDAPVCCCTTLSPSEVGARRGLVVLGQGGQGAPRVFASSARLPPTKSFSIPFLD
jgi:hypothetical protein